MFFHVNFYCLRNTRVPILIFSTGGLAARGAGRGGQSEGRRATISSALELEGTVSHEGDLTNFITKNLEQKIKMSSKPSLDCSDCEYQVISVIIMALTGKNTCSLQR